MVKDQIQQMLERYGAALSDGNFAGFANAWAVPAVVLSDAGALPVVQCSRARGYE
ncbi:MAG: hypothetical protein ACYC3P_09095 [Bellilinea sp.]